MIVLSEIKDRRKTKYIVDVLDAEGDILNSRIVEFPLLEYAEGNLKHHLLFDDDMNVVRSAFKYLEYEASGKGRTQSPKTIARKATVLRFFHIFLNAFNLDINCLAEEDIGKLIRFFEGMDLNPSKYFVNTTRCGETVNGYLSVIRSYLRFLGIECKALERYREVSVTIKAKGDTLTSRQKKYDNSLPTYNKDQVPPYITPDEFRKLYSLALKNNDTQACLIFCLGYVYGFRLGEILGLTIEDITEKEDHNTSYPVIKLRNRISDKPYQYAKNRTHVNFAESYSTPLYEEGSREITITYHLYDMLMKHIEELYDNHISISPEKYNKLEADIVSGDKFELNTNYYIFANENRTGSRLSDQAWNTKIKSYFIEAGIPLDFGKKESNLSHRLRHGFAMYHAHFADRKANEIELKDLMRHEKISSVYIYFNLTAEEELKLKEQFQEEMLQDFPELAIDFSFNEIEEQ